MAIATFVHEGRYIDYTPSSDVSAGDVIVQSDLVGIATKDIAADTLGELAIAGVFDIDKATGGGDAIAAGALVYWDSSADVADDDSDTGTNKLIGKAVKAAADADATVRVAVLQ